MMLFKDTQIATLDGRVVQALAIGNQGQPQFDWPQEPLALAVDVQDSFSDELAARELEEQVDFLERLAATPVTSIGWQADGLRIDIQGPVVGYTEAVPFQQPRATGVRDEWLCIGGKIQQDGVTFRIETNRLLVSETFGGIVGLRLTLAPDSVVIRAANLESVLAAGIGIPQPTSLFIPLYVLSPDGTWTQLLFQKVISRSPYYVNLRPGGPSGTLLIT